MIGRREGKICERGEIQWSNTKNLAKGGEQKEKVAGFIFLKLSLDIDIYIA